MRVERDARFAPVGAIGSNAIAAPKANIVLGRWLRHRAEKNGSYESRAIGARKT